VESSPDQYWGELIWDTDSGNEGKPLLMGQLSSLLLALHKGAADWLLAWGIDSPDFCIELVVPRELLNQDFDQLAGVNGPLGADHPLVVRSWERLRIAQLAAAAPPARLKINLKAEPILGSGDGGELTADAILRQRQRWEPLQRSDSPRTTALLEL